MLRLEARGDRRPPPTGSTSGSPGRCGSWPRAAGRVIVSGVGKSGLIARKIAATLTSTGTAASYLHPVDSLHGDLGIVGPDDVAIVLSKSGESEDLFGLVGSLQRLGVPIIAITGALDSRARPGGDGGARRRRWPRRPVPTTWRPTTSTTVALALGDALAVALLEVQGIPPRGLRGAAPGRARWGGGCCSGCAT